MIGCTIAQWKQNPGVNGHQEPIMLDTRPGQTELAQANEGGRLGLLFGMPSPILELSALVKLRGQPPAEAIVFLKQQDAFTFSSHQAACCL